MHSYFLMRQYFLNLIILCCRRAVSLIGTAQILALLALLVPIAAAANEPGQPLNGVELPAGATTAWVATNINQNGLPMAIQTFRSSMAVDSVLDFYRQRWAVPGKTPGFVENHVGAWQIISQLADDHNVVLQLQSNDSGGSSGFLSSVALNVTGFSDVTEVPAPADSELVSSARILDGDRVSTTSLLISQGDGGSIAGFYRDYFQRDGWVLASERVYAGHRILYFNRRHAQCELVVSNAADGSTVIALNQVHTHE